MAAVVSGVVALVRVPPEAGVGVVLRPASVLTVGSAQLIGLGQRQCLPVLLEQPGGQRTKVFFTTLKNHCGLCCLP